MPGADADMDHNLVAMTSHLQLKFIRNKKQATKRWDKETLKTRGSDLSQRIENKIREQEEITTTEERWTALRDIIVEEAEVTIGYQKGQAPRKPWITGEMLQEMEEGRKWRHQSTEEAKREYKRLNNKLRRTTKKAREQWWEGQCREIEELQRKGRHDKVYKIVKNSTKKPTQIGGRSVQDKDGVLLQDPEQVKKRWKEYVEDLYQAKIRPMGLGQNTVDEGEEETGPELVKEEILAAIKGMKNNKAEGIDNIPVEVLKSLGEKALKKLIQLCQDIYRTGEWPEDFLQTILIPLKKKANAVRCEEYRTISLLAHASKVLLRVLTKSSDKKTTAQGGSRWVSW